MSYKYTEAFDALGSDDKTKKERTERIRAAVLSEQTLQQTKAQAKAEKPTKAKPTRTHKPIGRRGIAWLTAAAVFVAAIAISVPVGINLYNNRGLLGAMNLLKDTFVDMDGVTAFGVWNAPDASSSSPRITSIASVRNSSRSDDGKETADEDIPDIVYPAPYDTEANVGTDVDIPDRGEDTGGDNGESSDIITGDWTDDERYDWESDYDWDPTKANVLISIGEDGTISEVVYERTNGRGQVRQDVLGNAAMVYVSDSFTYVMYVDDEEWEWWQKINFAQEMRYPSGFHCHHECMQTVVIHNATGNVYALKDVIPQVNELSGATNYTMQVHPYKNDFISICPMYGNGIPQWYNVVYDEKTEKIRYELMLPVEVAKNRSYNWSYFVYAARKDKYGQNYLLENHNTSEDPRITAGIVTMPSYTCYGKSLVFNRMNGIMFGSDERAYTFDEGKLKVFGENFTLSPVEPDTEVTIEGIANEFFYYHSNGNNEGMVYRLSGGYLYSMFGEVWKVDDDGTMHEYGSLSGSFPRYADDGWMLGGEMLAFVDTQEYGAYSVNGRIVNIKFETVNGVPSVQIRHIINASELSIQPNNRTVVEQNHAPLTSYRGETKYFLITVVDGNINVDFFARGYDGGVTELTKPITEPLTLI